MAQQPLGADVLEAVEYPPIADYGVIGDGRSVALVSRAGSIDWWCLPRFDGDPIFARILDERLGGFCTVRPRPAFESAHRYLGDTNILATEFTVDTGRMRVLDFMPALTEAQKRHHPVPFREIIRRVEGVSGRVPARLVVRTRPNYGTTAPRMRRQSAHRWAVEWGDQALHVTSSVPLTITPQGLVADVDVVAGQRLDLLLSFSAEAPAELPTLAGVDPIQQLTEQFWRDWSDRCDYHGPYREAVQRSALALKLLTYAPSGAIVAAPTTSLPESIGGVRNWDYRYCWLRDAAFTVRALLSIGYHREAHAFSEWLLHTTQLTHPELQVLYTIYGESHVPERTLGYLDGYCHSRPVRVGNAASNQLQLDVYGEVLDALRIYHRAGGTFDRDARNLVTGLANVITQRWREPDDGIWEVRSGRAQHVHSKVMAWAGLRAVRELAKDVSLGVSLPHLARVSDEIHAWVLAHGYDAKLGAFTRTPGHNLDASLLVIPLVDFLPGDDPRVVSTVETVQRHLAHGDLVYRYVGEDGLPGGEGAFVMCSFWLIEALAHVGRLDEAHAMFQNMLGRRNTLGLLSEEIDPGSGALLGNFPQAFSHLGLINAALTLEELERHPERR
ncbi:MAG TPA: glycoside hydrolase family 15 protein [Thermomicrobiaceae bacterium]|nr:glycoside hydrolase family 15 protein [Thermomicrobiaceae bacterium]